MIKVYSNAFPSVTALAYQKKMQMGLILILEILISKTLSPSPDIHRL